EGTAAEFVSTSSAFASAACASLGRRTLPDNVICCGLSALLSLKTTLPLCEPTSLLINVTMMVHDAAGLRLLPQSLVCEKDTPVEMLVMERAVAPVLVNVTA